MMVVSLDSNLCVGFVAAESIASSSCAARGRAYCVLPVEKNVALVRPLLGRTRWSWLVCCCEDGRACLITLALVVEDGLVVGLGRVDNCSELDHDSWQAS